MSSVLTITIADMSLRTPSIHDFIKQNAVNSNNKTRRRRVFRYYKVNICIFSATALSHSADIGFCLGLRWRSHFRYATGVDDRREYRLKTIGFFSLVGQAYVFKFSLVPADGPLHAAF